MQMYKMLHFSNNSLILRATKFLTTLRDRSMMNSPAMGELNSDLSWRRRTSRLIHSKLKTVKGENYMAAPNTKPAVASNPERKPRSL